MRFILVAVTHSHGKLKLTPALHKRRWQAFEMMGPLRKHTGD